jgi:hypothetical protein
MANDAEHQPGTIATTSGHYRLVNVFGTVTSYSVHGGGILLGGWWRGRQSETLEVQRAIDALPAAAVRYGAAGAQQWLTLMANNDVTGAHRDCQAVTGGGQACSYDLWSRSRFQPGSA